MKTRICASIAADNILEAKEIIDKAEVNGADIIELRLDYLSDTSRIEELIEFTSLPMIATNRQYEQGGFRIQDEDRRTQVLFDAADLGFHFIDVELTTPSINAVITKLKGKNTKIIVSFHNFEKTPNIFELESVMSSQMEVGADVCKLVSTAKEVTDNVTCLLLTSKMSEITEVVCFAMGRRGVLSRVISPFFGAYFTYASVEKGLETALGQVSIVEMRRLYRSLGVEN